MLARIAGPAFVAAAVLAAAACSDLASPPVTRAPGAAAFATAGGGSPKFSKQATTCTSSLTSITCDYKITGLGNTDLVDIFLTASVTVSGQCQNNGGQIVEAKDWTGSVTGSALNQQPQNGQIIGSLTVSASDAPTPTVLDVCPNANWSLINVSKTFVTAPNLYAIVHHQDGSSTQIESAF